jgi:cell division protein ZapA
METDKLDIRLLDKQFQVRCPTENREQLKAAASYLDGKMREIRDNGRVVGMERVAMMTALNITYDFLEAQHRQSMPSEQVTQRLTALHDNIEAALDDAKQLEFEAITE